MSRFYLHALSAIVLAFGVSGCTSLQESMASQMEVPTLENQANRVALGMTIVRENNIMAYKLPISADATWPKMVSKDLNKTDKKFIDKALLQDPYYATVHYTELLQRKMLGSSGSMSFLGDYANVTATLLNQKVSPLAYEAVYKISVLYGKDPKKWPDIFSFSNTKGDFLDFKSVKLAEVDAINGDVYDSLGAAVISLAPVNLQKDMEASREDMLDAFDEVASLKADKGDIENELKLDEANKKSKKKPKDFTPLSKAEITELQSELAVLEQQIKSAESKADEKESIYFQLLDSALVALESDIDLDDTEYVGLAKNINLVAREIDSGATQAYTAFGLALTNIVTSNIIAKFPRELESLAYSKAKIPLRLESQYNKRIERLVKNAVYLLPNVFMGTYYAHKQADLAQKYTAFTNVIVEAYETKSAQDKAATKAQEQTDKK